MPHTPLLDKELQNMALQLQNSANWPSQMLQHSGLNTPPSRPLMVDGLNHSEPQHTLNYQDPQ